MKSQTIYEPLPSGPYQLEIKMESGRSLPITGIKMAWENPGKTERRVHLYGDVRNQLREGDFEIFTRLPPHPFKNGKIIYTIYLPAYFTLELEGHTWTSEMFGDTCTDAFTLDISSLIAQVSDTWVRWVDPYAPLNPEYGERMENLAVFLERFPEVSVAIDWWESGGNGFEGLSLHHAGQVRDLLTGAGVAPGQIVLRQQTEQVPEDPHLEIRLSLLLPED